MKSDGKSGIYSLARAAWSALAFVVAIGALASTGPADASFNQWWAKFQSAVASRNARSVADGATFPLDWENGPTRKIPSQSDLEQRFDFYFTAEIKRIVAHGKPERLPNGSYLLSWKARGNEYSLGFRSRDPKKAGEFALDYLSEGPP